jgi:hypothetical protein
MDLLVLLFVLLVLPSALYLLGGRSGDVWGLVRRGQAKVGRGLYRAAPMILWARGKAPLSVRVAAFTSFLLGQMVIPGTVAAFVGFIVLFASLANGQLNLSLILLTLSAPTGIVVAGRLLAAGLKLLQRDARAVEQARRAARWELWHNGVLLGGLCLTALVGNEKDQIACLVVAVPAILAIAHGLLLHRAASTLEAYDAAQDDSIALGFGESAVPIQR